MSLDPIVHTVEGGTEFTGIADAGLYEGVVPTHKVLMLDIRVHLEGTAATVSIYSRDPDNTDNKVLEHQSSAAVNDFKVTELEVPTAKDGTAWAILVETSGKDDDGYVTFVPSYKHKEA